ncbi:hypothetical protein [Motiliproteus sp. SC1-56]|uniref:WD40/YVTN/BNR-like repeat-containing protein n=1 Tax=Motiliproteus sp. SC1-56 TaxID=2799565 RepID=UPI001A904CAD|nr:hypothetical protein [Motiliproteus sp. SC1-56]
MWITNSPWAALFTALFTLGLSNPLWAQNLNDLSHIYGIAEVPGNPDALYLATHNGFYRAQADGQVAQVSVITDDFMSLVSDPADPNGFFASGHPRGGGNLGLLHSEDGGRTWRQVSPGLNGPVDFHALAVSPVDPNRIYGMYRGLQISRDGGNRWTQGWLPEGSLSLAASYADVDYLYAATRNGLQMSKDGGQSWRPAMMMQLPASQVLVASDGYAYTFLVGRGLFKVKEPGLAWKPLGDPFDGAVPVQMAVSAQAPQRLYVLDNGGHLWRSLDGGAAWHRFGVAGQ